MSLDQSWKLNTSERVLAWHSIPLEHAGHTDRSRDAGTELT